MRSSFAIGDIHGCNNTLLALLNQLDLKSGDQLIFLGDYIDRGPDSKGVIDTIFDLADRGIETVCLRGNHEQLLLNGLSDPEQRRHWFVNGGEEALASFGVEHPKAIPARYFDFFNTTRYAFETTDYICVHGGPDFGAADPLANPRVLLWARYWYHRIDYPWLGGRSVLHGHTPESWEAIQEQYQRLPEQQYLNLDNGCVYATNAFRSRAGLGKLLAFCLDTGELFHQENLEA